MEQKFQPDAGLDRMFRRPPQETNAFVVVIPDSHTSKPKNIVSFEQLTVISAVNHIVA